MGTMVSAVSLCRWFPGLVRGCLRGVLVILGETDREDESFATGLTSSGAAVVRFLAPALAWTGATPDETGIREGLESELVSVATDFFRVIGMNGRLPLLLLVYES